MAKTSFRARSCKLFCLKAISSVRGSDALSTDLRIEQGWFGPLQRCTPYLRVRIPVLKSYVNTVEGLHERVCFTSCSSSWRQSITSASSFALLHNPRPESSAFTHTSTVDGCTHRPEHRVQPLMSRVLAVVLLRGLRFVLRGGASAVMPAGLQFALTHLHNKRHSISARISQSLSVVLHTP
jgi:hypothetical protein